MRWPGTIEDMTLLFNPFTERSRDSALCYRVRKSDMGKRSRPMVDQHCLSTSVNVSVLADSLLRANLVHLQI